MRYHRRSILAAIGLLFPCGLGGSAWGATPSGSRTELRFRSFEAALRKALEARHETADELPCCRVEVGHSDLLLSGVVGCHNERPFAGIPAGHLRIVRVGSEPGPNVGGVRLYVCTMDVLLTSGRDHVPSRPLDFALVPPAPILAAVDLEGIALSQDRDILAGQAGQLGPGSRAGGTPG